jgi:hypothetical protein
MRSYEESDFSVRTPRVLQIVVESPNVAADQRRADARVCSRGRPSVASARWLARSAGQMADGNPQRRWRGAKRPRHRSASAACEVARGMLCIPRDAEACQLDAMVMRFACYYYNHAKV